MRDELVAIFTYLRLQLLHDVGGLSCCGNLRSRHGESIFVVAEGREE